ncbi:MAG: hypothetical protein P1U38_11305 [Aeromicrobium sp.]|uniref:hypothetical protein n=1 Tax=Aeromicrobium sp. TaxID=1871063 RepID=UPI00262DE37A|nr:hypothetical protein [Aeromicrobium sp.]MDF1705351.1 hypothetical protein [Aeromicrobium sp.]
MTRRLSLLVLPLLGLFALGACSEVEDAISDTASDAGSRASCEIAQPAIEAGRSLVDDVSARIDADPAAAQRELTAAAEALGLGEATLSGEARDLVDRAGSALEELRAQAEAAADGTTVDDQVVQAARDEYDAAAEQLTGVC